MIFPWPAEFREVEEEAETYFDRSESETRSHLRMRNSNRGANISEIMELERTLVVQYSCSRVRNAPAGMSRKRKSSVISNSMKVRQNVRIAPPASLKNTYQ